MYKEVEIRDLNNWVLIFYVWFPATKQLYRYICSVATALHGIHIFVFEVAALVFVFGLLP